MKMDTKQHNKSMKILCWSFLGMILMVIAFIFSGCKTAKEMINERIDSVYIEKLIPYSLPADSAAIYALLECTEEGEVILQHLDMANTKNIQMKFALDSIGNLKTGIKVQYDTLYLPSKEKIVTVDKIIQQTVEVEKEFNWWTRLRIWVGNLAVIVGGVWILIKLIKMKFVGTIR